MSLGLMRSALACATVLSGVAGAAMAAPLPVATPLVKDTVDDSITLTLPRDRPGALARATDRGVLDAATALPHIRLTLTRPASLQAALDRLTHDQHVKGSADFHRWLTPADLRSYGPAQADIDRVVAWLTSHGLTVNSVSPSGMSIDFGGSAAQVAAAFHTELHNVTRGGEAHIANISAPAIPAALAPVVTGVTLANFFPKPAMRRVSPNLTVNGGSAGTFYAVAPADFAKIYNVNPLRGSNNVFGAPITGAGVTLAVVEQTKIRSKDWDTFRSTFGLSAYKGTLTQVHPGDCTPPGTTGDEGEAALDAEWSSAMAPDADILEASCAGTAPFEFGVLTSLQNLVEKGTKATIFSISYGGDEIANGYGFEAAWTNLVQEGAAEGIAIFVSTGDSGTSGDEGSLDTVGLFVNGLSDTAYNVAVGGTDFYDTALGQNATYWHKSNGQYGASALSYIPEIPWNNGCSSSVLWKFNGGTSATQFCNSGFTGPLQNDIGGSGGQSVYYTKPDWQLTSIPGMPNDGVRDQPDVSLFAANGIWNHFYLLCMSDTNEGGAKCDYHNLNDTFANAAGGTSFASPAFAGIAALIQQALDGFTPGTKLGNPAPVFYQIAAGQYGTPLGLNQCNATLGKKISSSCVFYVVTAGDNSEPCAAGTANCKTDKASTQGIGVLYAHVGKKTEYAYPAQSGYSLATGLGTVNVTNLVAAYSNY
jgi:subtilase family serine protease